MNDEQQQQGEGAGAPPAAPPAPTKIGLAECRPNEVVQVDTPTHDFFGDAGRVISVDAAAKTAVVQLDVNGEQAIAYQDLRRIGSI